MTNGKEKKFDLTERTALMGESVITFARSVKLDEVTRPLVRQLVRSGTSIGANYVEADEADTRKEFKYRIGLARREARETKHWLRMIVHASPATRDAAVAIYREADELVKIFSKIRSSTSA
jgi:four helix bundle protein